jgi:SAM-dependent methyltransferase
MSNLTYLTPAQRTARDVWTSGNYPEVAERLIRGFGPVLVDELRIGPGQRVLDVACGAGNVAIPAALAGARADYLALAERLPAAVVVDADRTPDALRAAVVDRIWRALLADRRKRS